MTHDKKGHILSTFQPFKSYLPHNLSKPQNLPINHQHLAKTPHKLPHYLPNHQHPPNPHQNLLHQLSKLPHKQHHHHLPHM
ncbi:DUF3243 family protein, partial [Priestia megaterium]|uniref:DUF3243 family protein n=1 Tax=Priestia megaterium TaxID=1404 RepID=UPI0037098141